MSAMPNHSINRTGLLQRCALPHPVIPNVGSMKILRLAFGLSLLTVAFSAAPQDAKPLESNEWPTTVAAAVTDIVSAISDGDKVTVRETKRSDLIKFHHGWGTGIRNHYGLWRGNKKLVESACGKPCHPDDASMIIIEKVWEALQEKR